MAASKRPTPFEYSIIGLISLGKAAGYDLVRIFADTPMRQYSAGLGSVYPALRRLEQRGVVRSAADGSSGKRRRRVYSLTRAGRRLFTDWLHEEVSADEVETDVRTSLLRFSFMQGHCSTQQVLRYLSSFETEMRRYLKDLEQRQRAFHEMGAAHAFFALDNGIRALRAHIRWAQATRTALPKFKTRA